MVPFSKQDFSTFVKSGNFHPTLRHVTTTARNIIPVAWICCLYHDDTPDKQTWLTEDVNSYSNVRLLATPPTDQHGEDTPSEPQVIS